MRMENHTDLKQVRLEAQRKLKETTCRVLVCGGTGCLAGGSDKIYRRLLELAVDQPRVSVEFGP